MPDQSPDAPATPPDLARFEPALLFWARHRLPACARGKLDPADLVQQTLLEVISTPDKLAGRPDHEALAYLRRALTNNITDAARKFARDGFPPDIASQSSIFLAEWLAAADTSPSERAARNERYEKLAVAIFDLPDDQRTAVEMRYLQGIRVKDIAAAFGRTEGAVSLLLNRAMKAMRDVLADLDG